MYCMTACLHATACYARIDHLHEQRLARAAALRCPREYVITVVLEYVEVVVLHAEMGLDAAVWAPHVRVALDVGVAGAGGHGHAAVLSRVGVPWPLPAGCEATDLEPFGRRALLLHDATQRNATRKLKREHPVHHVMALLVSSREAHSRLLHRWCRRKGLRSTVMVPSHRRYLLAHALKQQSSVVW